MIYGMNGTYSDAEIKEAVNRNTLESYVRSVPVRPGDFVYIPAGTVHAIGPGLRLLEVQQSCDITYRLYDWGRGRECHLDKAVSCIKNLSVHEISQFKNTFECPYFTLEKFNTEENKTEAVRCPEASGPLSVGLIFVLEGYGTINGEKAQREDIFAFKDGEHLKAEGNLTLMRIIPGAKEQ